jgi:hypothetical protein
VGVVLDHKTFRIVANDGPGTGVNEETVFHFRQDGDVAHADYFGGGVQVGKLRLNRYLELGGWPGQQSLHHEEM